jgi:TetR/AcrR family transcriptional repressor of nem operon
MKKSRLEAAETRRRIVKTAAEEFRRNGIHATGLSDVMAAAGLTHGGFYRHFDSKDQLVAEACAAAMEAAVESIGDPASDGAAHNSLEAIVTSYLCPDHRDNLSKGCLIAALGTELARSDDKTRAVATAGFLKFVDLIAEQYRQTKPKAAKSRALVAASAMIGAVLVSRIVTDPELSAAILRETEKHVLDLQ